MYSTPRLASALGADCSPPLAELVTELRPRRVFYGHVHGVAQAKVGPTTLVALDDFSRRPAASLVLLEKDG